MLAGKCQYSRFEFRHAMKMIPATVRGKGMKKSNQIACDSYRPNKKVIVIAVNMSASPPMSGFFQLRYISANTASQGSVLGMLVRIPSKPPPYASAPDRSAKVKNIEFRIRRRMSVILWIVLRVVFGLGMGKSLVVFVWVQFLVPRAFPTKLKSSIYFWNTGFALIYSGAIV